MIETPQDSEEQIRKEAAQWFARLRSVDVTPETEQTFSAWLKRGPQYEAAFNTVRMAWETLGALPEKRRPRRRTAVLGRRELLTGAVAASVAAYFVLRPEPAEAKVFKTAVGEQARFTLPDGSGLFLDTASEVSARCDGRERSAVLTCGRAHFEVSNSLERALNVQAGDISITSRRGIFDIYRDDDIVRVFLQKSDAAVQTGTGKRFVLRAGERLTATLPEGAGTIDRPDRNTAIAWQRGILIFDRTTLADAVHEMNRYSRIQMTIKDTAIAQLKISGAYGAGKTAEFLHSVALLLPVRVKRQGNAFQIASAQ